MMCQRALRRGWPALRASVRWSFQDAKQAQEQEGRRTFKDDVVDPNNWNPFGWSDYLKATLAGIATWYFVKSNLEMEAVQVQKDSVRVHEEEVRRQQHEQHRSSPEYLSCLLKQTVSKVYEPQLPPEYIPRVQDDDLKRKLKKWVEDGYGGTAGFFLLVGESGSGKTTMMGHVLKQLYEKGVLFVSIDSIKLTQAASDGGAGVRDYIEEEVEKIFGDARNHPHRSGRFVDFVADANAICKKEHEHPLILYITLDSKQEELDYKTMVAIGGSVGGLASDLSSKTSSAKTIVEFSKTGISDTIRGLRPDLKSFNVNGMTEDEFPPIGKLALGNPRDPQGVLEPFLKHYHDWLGGQTKTLKMLAEEDAGIVRLAAEATEETEKAAIAELKKRVDTEFAESCDYLVDSLDEDRPLVTRIAEAGSAGTEGRDSSERSAIKNLLKRDSDLTLIRRTGRLPVRIHHYPHALYLHGVTGPDVPDVQENIHEVKMKFELAGRA